MGAKSSKQVIDVPESFVMGFKSNRSVYFWIILVISVFAVIGNIFAIKSVIFRKYRNLQKTCVISLALSDLLSVALFGMSNLDVLSKRYVTWSLGEFMCHYLPVGQVIGNLASSIALLVIALDRYHNVIYAFNKKWDPGPWKCFGGTILIWTFCIGLSYPVVSFYLYFLIRVNGEERAMCYGIKEEQRLIMMYYLLMNALFFIPIISLFFWFYYKIAKLIWRHRKPLSNDYSQHEVTENTSSGKDAQESYQSPTKPIPRRKNIQMERKKRSFKIVLTLIIAFVGCRMPYWLFMAYKLVLTSASSETLWQLGFLFTALNLLNCALNPFLYTYLNITVIVCRRINECMCCFFSNNDFEEFETGKPIAEGVMGCKKDEIEDKQVSDDKKPRVYFIDVSHLSKYTQKEVY